MLYSSSKCSFHHSLILSFSSKTFTTLSFTVGNFGVKLPQISFAVLNSNPELPFFCISYYCLSFFLDTSLFMSSPYFFIFRVTLLYFALFSLLLLIIAFSRFLSPLNSKTSFVIHGALCCFCWYPKTFSAVLYRVRQNKISQHKNCYISEMPEYFCTKFRSSVWHTTVH